MTDKCMCAECLRMAQLLLELDALFCPSLCIDNPFEKIEIVLDTTSQNKQCSACKKQGTVGMWKIQKRGEIQKKEILNPPQPQDLGMVPLSVYVK